MSKITMRNKNQWLLVLGVRAGHDLPADAKNFLGTVDAVIGSPRNLAMVRRHLPPHVAVRPLARPFASNLAWLKKMKGQNKKIAFVATGDPSFFGAAKILRQQLGHDGMVVVPAVSIVSLVAARMGWAVEDAIFLSTHGTETTRPVNQLVRHLHPGANIIVIARDGAQLVAIAHLLQQKNWGASQLTIFANIGEEMMEDMGEDKEAVTTMTAAAITTAKPFASDFYTIAINVAASKNSNRQEIMTTAGHGEDFFIHDGQITKAETRAIILSALQPAPQKLLWDVGAGSGSVAIEWCLRGGRAIAVEQKKNRHDNIVNNILQFGLGQAMTAVHQPADKFLNNKKNEQPHVIFVGGGVSDQKLMTKLWQALPPRGRWVSASHSVEGQMAQHGQQQQWGGKIITIAISEKKPMAGSKQFHTMAPQQQTTLHIVDKI